MNPPKKLTRARATEIASLDKQADRRRLGQFRIEGWRSVESALDAGVSLVDLIVKSELHGDPRLERFDNTDCQVLTLPSKSFSRLSSVVENQGVVGVARIPNPNAESLVTSKRVVVLDGIQDPGNVGTLVRSAAWFGFDALIAGPGTADFFNPKVVRSAAGAIWDLGLFSADDLASQLRELDGLGFHVVGTALDGSPLSDAMRFDRCVLVLGSEAQGMSSAAREHVETLVRIEGDTVHSGVESLNVAAAGAILMHHLRPVDF